MEFRAENADFAAKYLSLLCDLTSNDKIMIDQLTKLAGNGQNHDRMIVDIITQHLSKVIFIEFNEIFLRRNLYGKKWNSMKFASSSLHSEFHLVFSPNNYNLKCVQL